MTALVARKIYARHSQYKGWIEGGTVHPLQGKTVSEWVAEARKGWPKVPVPKDPWAAAQKLAEKYSEVEVDAV